MAAKLEWSGDALMLGSLRVAQIVLTHKWWRFKIPVNDRSNFFSVGHDKADDCRAAAESEVRRLLKEAGVEIET